MTPTSFSPLSFVAVFGSGIQDPGSGLGKIKIRDKHTGSATLLEKIYENMNQKKQNKKVASINKRKIV
jgi:hypothetical protein